jgi:hypothetical protein
MAMASGASQSMRTLGDAGELSASKFLGFSHDGLIDGTGLKKLGVIFGALLLISFVMPVITAPVDYDEVREKFIFENVMSWDAWKFPNVSKFALLLPLILGALGIAIAVAPKIPAHVRAIGLAVLGLLGLFFCLNKVGELIGTPSRTITLLNIGVIVAGVSATMRVLRPKSKEARYGLAAGAGIIALGFLIPLGDLANTLPGEFRKWSGALELDLGTSMPLSQLLKSLDRRVPEVTFTSMLILAPLLAAPAAAWFAWKMPAGPWDKGSLALRPLTWLLVLFIPLLYALLAFNAVSTDKADEAVLMGRLRVLVIAVSFTMWIQIAGAAVFDWVLRHRGAEAPEAPEAPGG